LLIEATCPDRAEGGGEAMNKDVVLRLYKRTAGKLTDLTEDIDLSQTAGIVPSVGDRMVVGGQIATVTERIFNPKGIGNYVIVVPEIRSSGDKDRDAVVS
jgi:hypothetical protein